MPFHVDDLSPDARAVFDARLVRHDCTPGQSLVHKGDPVSGAYFVMEGRLRVYAFASTGKEATLYTLEPGETCVLALNSLFNDVLYPAWVESECETTVGILPGPVYRDLFSREAAVQDLTVRALSSAVFRLIAELEQVHAQSLDQRLASFLLARASGSGEVRLTQQQIAAHVGSTREGVARLLGAFVDQGWVKTGRGQVHIINAAELAGLFQCESDPLTLG